MAISGMRQNLIVLQYWCLSMKRIVYVAFCIAALLAAYLYFRSDYFASMVMHDVGEKIPANNQGEIDRKRPSESAGSTLQEASQGHETEVLSDDEIREVREWVEERGWDVSENTVGDEMMPEQNSYHAYSEEALAQLADGGDRKAQQMLGEKLLSNESTHNRAVDYLFESAARGYSKPFFTVGLEYQNKYFNARASVEEKASFGIAAYGWLKIGKQRRDYNAEVIFNTIDSRLTEAERKKGEEYADALYRQLLNKRTELGLSEFNNLTPPAVEKVRRQTLLRNKMPVEN